MGSPLKTVPRMPAGGRGNSLHLSIEESELRYRRLFETAQDGILILDAESGKIIDANAFLLDLLDYRFEGLLGLHLWEIGEFKDITASREAFEVLQTNEYIRYENLPLVTRSGKTIQVEFVSNVYFTGQHRVIQCNIRDISGRNELGLSRERIAALEAAGDEKDKIIALLSHELRTPLTAISAMVDLVEMSHDLAGMNVDAKEPRFDQAAVALIRRNVGTVTRLLTEVQELSRIAHGKVELKLSVVDLHDTVRLVLRNHESQRKAKLLGIDLQLNAIEHYVMADPSKLEQILANLIDNALKFTPKAGKVAIVSRNQDEELILEISDQGIGIAPDALERIFSPFVQRDPSIHSRFGGLGLGLSIAWNLAMAQKGRLEAYSAGLGQGATFALSFKTQNLAARASSPQPQRGEGAQILLMESNEDVRHCLSELLEANGHEVTTAADCKAARALCDCHDFDVLIADTALADGSAADLLEYLRRSCPAAQGIAISGFGLPEDLAATKSAGFAAHVLKPIEFRLLAATIDDLVPATSGRVQATSVLAST